VYVLRTSPENYALVLARPFTAHSSTPSKIFSIIQKKSDSDVKVCTHESVALFLGENIEACSFS
jgi:hypothetical protein